MKKVLKINKKQLMLLKEFEDSFNEKTILLTTNQITMLNEKFSLSDKISNNFKKSFSGTGIKTESDTFIPQTEKENEETFKSFNKPTLKEFATNVFEYLRNNLKGSGKVPSFFKENKIKTKKLNKALRVEKVIKDCVIGEDRTIKLNKDIKTSISRMYEMFFPIDMELNESDSALPIGVQHDSRAPFNQNSKTTKPKEVSNIKYKELFTKGRTSIFTDGKNLFYFDFQNSEDEEFYEYIEREYEITGKDEDGDYEIEYDDDVLVDGDVIELFVNDNVNYLNNGKGPSSEIKGVNYMGNGDYDFILLDDESKEDYLKMFKRDPEDFKTLKNIFNINDIEETTTTGASSGQYNGPLNNKNQDFNKTPKEELENIEEVDFNSFLNLGEYGVYEMVSGDIDENDNHIVGLQNEYGENNSSIIFMKENNKVKVGFRPYGGDVDNIAKYADNETLKKITEYIKRVNSIKETTTTGASSGAYSTPKIWAKSSTTTRFGKTPVYPNGEIIENKGSFVEFDDCVNIGSNNKDALNGKCSQGAIDDVVKTKETIYKEIAKKTGKTLEEVTKIIKNKYKN